MIKNYFKIAVRNLIRQRSFTLLNVLGLAVGMAACLILYVVVKYEFSYNKSVTEHSQVFRVITEDKKPDETFFNPGIPFPALESFRRDFPNVVTGALHATNSCQITVLGKDPNAASSKRYIENNRVFFADPEFFQVFPYKWLAATPAILLNPDAVVLTRTMAAKYFGSWQASIGQYLKMDNALTVRVAGAVEDLPLNTDFPMGMFTSLITSRNHPELYGYATNWNSTTSNFQLYMRLPANMTQAQMDAQLLANSGKYYPPNPNGKRFNFVQPLDDIHFDRRLPSFGDHVISKGTLWTLSLIGAFILVMACINFINLSTAQAVNRSKEIGIRKVLGGKRSSLFWQMMGETAMIVAISLLLAIGLATLALPYIKGVASISEPINIFTRTTMFFAVGVAFIVTALSGAYPSLILSGFRPMLALKNKITSASIGGLSLRRGLVITQFTISQMLVIGTIIAITQMSYVRHADLGFNQEAVLVLSSNSDSAVMSRMEAFKQALLTKPGIEAVSFSSDVPSSDNTWSTNFAFDQRPDENFSLSQKFADADYFKTFGLTMVAGKPFEPSDTIRDVVINETLVHKLGLRNANEAIGKGLRMGAKNWHTIVGVTKDFRTNSLREATQPVVIASWQKSYGTTSVKMTSRDLASTRATVQSLWDKYYPEYANTSVFMDESVENFYKQENQLALLYKIFAGIAILISCLGLYGLVSFMAVQRTKEVGIRKVLGASASHIVYLFSKEFTILILIAFVVAAPIAWYVMNNWLNNFSYRVHPGIAVFGSAILLSIIVAWLTVGYKSIRAALMNPVRSLRNE